METVTALMSVRISDVRTGQETREFDAVDTKGRRFGAAATKTTQVYETQQRAIWPTAHNLANANENRRPDGTYYAFRPTAMRGGDFFGASHGENIYASEAERDAAVERYFADAEKRALKNKARALPAAA